MSRANAKPAAPASATLDDYVLYEQVGHLLRRAHQRATSIFMREMSEHDLTPLQFAALTSIADQSEVSQNALGRLTAMDPATVHGVTRRLRERKLIQARPDPTDGRRTLLSLTAAGRTLVTAAVPNGIEITDETLRPLTARERKTLNELLHKLK